MTTIQDELVKAGNLIQKNRLKAADAILHPIKCKHPLLPGVAKLWCTLAMKTGRAAEVPAYADTLYAQAENDFQRAYWAQQTATARFMLLELEAAKGHFEAVLNHLMNWAKSGKVPQQKKRPAQAVGGGNVFSSGKAEELLWDTCAALAEKEIPAFPFAGTLLGLVRNDCLLEFDKDLDIAVWMDAWPACCSVLEELGWVRTPMRIDYDNYRDYVHPETGITLDVCGLKPDGQRIVGGFSLPDRPSEYQRVSVFPVFDLMQRQTERGAVYFPRQPELILKAFYGDWRTPNPNWDTVISACNLESFTLLVRCYAYHRLAQRWLMGDLEKAWCYAYQIVLKEPDDVTALRSRQWLERALAKLNRALPFWPDRRPSRRIFTRMVADLFHPGHINFLRAAKSLGTHLTVCVVPDQRVLDYKGKLPVMTQAERVAAVSACTYVDRVITESPVNATQEFMQRHGFDVYAFACANDRERADKYQQCALLPREMVQELDYTPGISTTDIVQRIINAQE